MTILEEGTNPSMRVYDIDAELSIDLKYGLVASDYLATIQ